MRGLIWARLVWVVQVDLTVWVVHLSVSCGSEMIHVKSLSFCLNVGPVDGTSPSQPAVPNPLLPQPADFPLPTAHQTTASYVAHAEAPYSGPGQNPPPRTVARSLTPYTVSPVLVASSCPATGRSHSVDFPAATAKRGNETRAALPLCCTALVL